MTREKMTNRHITFPIFLVVHLSAEKNAIFGCVPKPDPNLTGLRLHMSFESRTGQRSFLRLMGTVVSPDTVKDTDCHEVHRFEWRFPASAFAEDQLPFSIIAIPKEEALPPMIAAVPGSQKVQTSGSLHRVRFQIGINKAVSKGVRVAPSHVLSVQDFTDLRKSLSSPQADVTIYIKGGSALFVNFGFPTPREERPYVSKPYPAQDIFWDFGEYSTYQGYGALRECETMLDLHHELAVKETGLKIMEVPRAGNRAYIVFLTSAHSDFKLVPGDVLKVKLSGVYTTDTEEHWTAVITDILPIAPVGMTTAILYRRKIQDKKSWVEESEFERGTDDKSMNNDADMTQPSNGDKNGDDEAQPTPEAKVKEVKYDPLVIDSIPDRGRWPPSDHQRKGDQALRKLDLSHEGFHDFYKGVLLGSEPSMTSDLYGGLSESDLNATIAQLPLSKAQERVLRTDCRQISNRTLLNKGPPGTGKTFILAKILAADAAADSVQGAIDAAGLKEKIIVRFHARDSEQDVVYSGAKSKFTNPKPRQDLVDAIPDGDTTLAEFETARFVSEHFHGPLPPTDQPRDRRVRRIAMSVGAWILRLIGHEESFITDVDGWDNLHGHYEQYITGDLKPKDYNAASSFVWRNFKAQVLCVDEAGMATELDVAIGISHFNPEHIIIMTGDDKQLPPVVLDKTRSNPFVNQIKKSLFARLCGLGYPVTFLSHQHGMTIGLVQTSSDLFYNGRLEDGPALPRSKIPHLLLNVQYTTVGRSATASRFNLGTLRIGINTLGSLIKAGFKAEDIAIITLYQSQYDMYRAAVANLERARPDLKLRGLRIAKVDGFQGKEAPIVILDLVVGKEVGFADDKNRINVAITRCREALIVVAAASDIKENPKASNLIKIIGVFYEQKLVHNIRVTDADASNIHVKALHEQNPTLLTLQEAEEDDRLAEKMADEGGEGGHQQEWQETGNVLLP
ncbi:MAG: hypothetical protein M1816_004891 [Peltula sp. TS41687]|nr:MAG: hypothetical protein M1816_004891 [Peltula sp. TS41687]